MRNGLFSVRHFLATLPKRKLWLSWRGAMGVLGLVGCIVGGSASPTQAATTVSDRGFYQDAALAAPKIGQQKLGTPQSGYYSTSVERGIGTTASTKIVGTTATATSRCPAFVSWEDWGGSRVHAYVDFRPSDLCNGQHVKRAYVRLIRQCGPYYDTGRIYTDTASSITDTRLYSVSVWIFDSPLWSCVTKTYYGYDYF